jgi:hypothetical protein
VNNVIIPRKAFAPYVANGTFELRTCVGPLREPSPPGFPHVRGVIRFLYAKRSEAWRIDAYLTMWDAAAKSGWNEGFERLEGALLGYTEWQNDLHIQARWPKGNS